MKNTDRKYFAFFDIVIIVLVIIVAAVSLLPQFSRSDTALECVIRVNGEVVETVRLNPSEDLLRQYTAAGDMPVNVMIGSDSVWVESASCPDKLCEHTGAISRSGQSIVCLPAKVTVTLESVDSTDLDVVVG